MPASLQTSLALGCVVLMQRKHNFSDVTEGWRSNKVWSRGICERREMARPVIERCGTHERLISLLVIQAFNRKKAKFIMTGVWDETGHKRISGIFSIRKVPPSHPPSNRRSRILLKTKTRPIANLATLTNCTSPTSPTNLIPPSSSPSPYYLAPSTLIPRSSSANCPTSPTTPT